jgi:DUF4097 and DUF4098 domain-containing protein YvlB
LALTERLRLSRMKWFVLFFSFVFSCQAADKITVQRDGDTQRWKLTVTGSLPAQPITRIAAFGNVTIRGKRTREIRYSVSQEVAASSEQQVRQLAEFYRAQTRDGQLVFFQPGAVSIEMPRNTALLTISSNAGTIDVADIEGSLRADANAGRIVLDRIGGNVEIHSNGGAASLGTIGGVVRCYSGGGSIRAVRINGGAYFETDGGDIQLGQVLGAVTALTAAGGIRIDQAGAGVFADTLGGPISVLRALGMVVANSAGGPIDIGDATSVQCQNGGGTIRLNNVSGTLRAATDHGSIIAAILAGRPLEDSFLSTGSGDITVFIPSNMGVTVDAEANGVLGSRPIVSDFSGLRVSARRLSVAASGKINGGGPLLRLTVTGGRIEIKRR